MGGALCSGDGLEVMPCKLPSCAPAKDHRQDACDNWSLHGGTTSSRGTYTRANAYTRNPAAKYYAAPPPADKECRLG